MKKIAILGSTGSIGTQTLEVVRENKDIEVLGLAAENNIKLLEAQIREFMPKKVAVWTEEKAAELLRFKLGFLGWIPLCVAIFPLLYLIPYYKQSLTCLFVTREF